MSARQTIPALLLAMACGRDPSRIPARTLARQLEETPERYALIDVRSRGEWRASTGHIEGAQHLAWPGIKKRAAEIEVLPGQEIVLICLTGHRSQWAQEAVATAWPEVPIRDLRGGMVAWWARRLGVVREGSSAP